MIVGDWICVDNLDLTLVWSSIRVDLRLILLCMCVVVLLEPILPKEDCIIEGFISTFWVFADPTGSWSVAWSLMALPFETGSE